MKTPVDTLARKSTTKRKRSSILRRTRTTVTSAKWKVHTRSKDFLPFAFCINAQSLPELLPDYVPTKKSVGRPKLEPFSPYKDIHEAIHRKALELAFDGKETISGYKALEEELTTAYELAGTKFNHNKIVKIIQFLTNKRMVVQESRGIYRFMPDYHY